jgi:hypothetical protein
LDLENEEKLKDIGTEMRYALNFNFNEDKNYKEVAGYVNQRSVKIFGKGRHDLRGRID